MKGSITKSLINVSDVIFPDKDNCQRI